MEFSIENRIEPKVRGNQRIRAFQQMTGSLKRRSNRSLLSSSSSLRSTTERKKKLEILRPSGIPHRNPNSVEQFTTIFAVNVIIKIR